MRFLSFEIDGRARPGAELDEQRILDIRTAAELTGRTVYRSVLAMIEAGEQGLDTVAELISDPAEEAIREKASVRLLAPLPVPQQIRDFANYEEHCLAAMDASMRLRAAGDDDPQAAYQQLRDSSIYCLPPIWYEIPLYYKGNRFAVNGHQGTVEWPAFSDFLDYELELACVIGRQCRDVESADAKDVIFGYTIFNDFSARDVQSRWEGQFRMGPAKGKDFDTSNSFGPVLVTKDEIVDPYNLDMVVRVNDKERGRGNSGGAQHDFEACIAQVSRSETLHPGEILGLGTIPGGCGYETLTSLEPGDVVELEIEGIGKLRNTISNRRMVAGDS